MALCKGHTAKCNNKAQSSNCSAQITSLLLHVRKPTQPADDGQPYRHLLTLRGWSERDYSHSEGGDYSVTTVQACWFNDADGYRVQEYQTRQANAFPRRQYGPCQRQEHKESWGNLGMLRTHKQFLLFCDDALEIWCEIVAFRSMIIIAQCSKRVQAPPRLLSPATCDDGMA